MVEMEQSRNSIGSLIIDVDEDTRVTMQRDGVVVLRQDIGGDTERVYLSVGRLKKIVELIKEEEERIFYEEL
jgi:hypothetical protein